MKNIKSIVAVLSLALAFAFSASAQNVVFTSIEGEKIDIQSNKGKVVVMAIGATWLPLSRNQSEAINKLAKKYAGRDVVFYFIATDSDAAKNKNYASNEQLRSFASNNKLGVTVLRDSEGKISASSFKVDQLPVFIVLDKEGKLATKPFTGIDPKDDISVPISQAIDSLL
jgi:thiol-disulfide isomerase/thioredoxin